MSVFVLFVHSCITFGSMLPSGGSTTVTCRSDQRDIYETKDACERDGKSEVGKPIFSDVADGRAVDSYVCSERIVIK